jgi:hypothetical protein
VLVVVVTVRGVAVAIVDVVHMIPVLDRVVPAVRSVRVVMGRGDGVDLVDRALVVVVTVHRMGVTVVQVVDVAVVLHEGVAAVGGVDVGVGIVCGAGCAHVGSLRRRGRCRVLGKRNIHVSRCHDETCGRTGRQGPADRDRQAGASGLLARLLSGRGAGIRRRLTTGLLPVEWGGIGLRKGRAAGR